MILENISQSTNRLVPANIEQYTALQILLDFKDHPSNIRKYLMAAERHGASALLQAHRRVRRTNDSADAFFVQLTKH